MNINTAIKINSFAVENVKRVKSVSMQLSPEGLTVIGGRNGQGKTSILDAIAYALGGEKYRPSDVMRDGAMANPEIRIELSNGLLVTRRGKNSALTVIDREGRRQGQTLLNEFVSQFAIDLPRFLGGSEREKADALLTACGLSEQVAEADRAIKAATEERRIAGREAKNAQAYADGLPVFEDAPGEPISAAELIRQQQDMLARNGERQRRRMTIDKLKSDFAFKQDILANLERQVEEARRSLRETEEALASAQVPDAQLILESTEALEAALSSVEATNAKVAANRAHKDAQDVANGKTAAYDMLNEQVEQLRSDRLKLFETTTMPLPGLAVDEDYHVTYMGHAWDCMSGSEQMRVAAAIARKVKPQCGFILLDKLEQMDAETMREFAAWLEAEHLQAIATRVTTNKDECTIIIEDGTAESQPDAPAAPTAPVSNGNGFQGWNGKAWG